MTLLYASPVFLAAVALFALIEFFWRKRSGKGYDLAALGGTFGIALGQFVSKAVTGGIVAAGLFAAYEFAPIKFPIDDWRSWAAGFFAVEFFYYWQHRFMHTVRWFWATHAVHHSPNEMTLPAALRLGWTGAISGAWLFYLAPVLLGFHPIVIGVLLILNLRYQYFLHTEAVGKLGPLEWVLNTPSHHRVHHGSNPDYLDRNFGGVLIVFDRLFGSFAEEKESEPVIYGLTDPLLSNNPFTIAFHEWGRLFGDLRQAQSCGEIFRTLFGRPGMVLRQQPQPLPALTDQSVSTAH